MYELSVMFLSWSDIHYCHYVAFFFRSATYFLPIKSIVLVFVVVIIVS